MRIAPKKWYKLSVVASLLGFVLSSAAAPIAMAVEYDQYFYSINDVLYFNPESAQPCEPSSGGVVLGGRDNLEKIFNFMLSKGLSREQAAGVVGNVSQESGGNPTATQSGPETDDPSVFGTAVGVGKAWGIIQWDAGGRVLEYQRRAGVSGNIADLATQLEIVWWHMTTETPTSRKNFINEYKLITDVTQATIAYEKGMTAAGTPMMENRIAAARLALADFTGAVSTSPATTTSVGVLDCDQVGNGAAAGNVVQTALNYAWEDQRDPPYTEKKPAYEAAVTKAVSEGRYVGGDEYPGVDCGGFITLVMQDSGVDPDYNNTSTYKGNTIAQQGYLDNSGKYTKLVVNSTADLRPGDIAISNNLAVTGRHTYMFVGDQPGFETQVASASVSYDDRGWRAPMAGYETPADKNYDWYRLK